ncbi:phosphate/phosphite/phosphonate ABC transporter substrate-binding protein [Paenibacillus ginsengarvi]|uniref:Phosphate/phosphite/phosphonate ABC transporter substrate-binding protein n=1 Tax=Paenibacillus ginsengarvi TaxID=400777 RepID=A0A3B0B035_9BACL|nr:phosphate/phosphite/phosphonate ABC transporter substrate-binding protein [Paenibacillus ginsengarvi]RKN66133.1 phosphate/phosphite/phosphonate ABC transporter substrate-binding protein [Paenibacillus ginsengarvi]
MFKKVSAIGISVILAAGLAVGCAKKEEGNKSAAGGYVPKELKVQFVPSQNAETLEAKAKPLEKLLGDKLGIPVKVSVSTDYNTVIEAMASKQVDIGFLPPTNYVVAHDTKKAADLLLQATRLGVDDKTGQPTTELVDSYKSMIVVKADSPIKDIKDLKGKKIGWQGTTSAAGYTYPALLMKKNGIDPMSDVTGVQFQGHDKAIIGLLNGQVDAVAVFQDIRAQMQKDVPDVMQKTRVLAFTDKIPNDTIAVRPDMSDEWKKKISDAFIAIGKDPQGQQIIFDVYTHKGYVVGKDENFNVVRDANKQLGGK